MENFFLFIMWCCCCCYKKITSKEYFQSEKANVNDFKTRSSNGFYLLSYPPLPLHLLPF